MAADAVHAVHEAALQVAVRDAVREEFEKLQSSLLQEVRREFHHSKSGPLEGMAPMATINSDRSVRVVRTLVSPKFRGMRNMKVKEYQKWLHELDDVDTPSTPKHLNSTAESAEVAAAAAAAAAVASERSAPSDQSGDTRRGGLRDVSAKGLREQLQDDPVQPVVEVTKKNTGGGSLAPKLTAGHNEAGAAAMAAGASHPLAPEHSVDRAESAGGPKASHKPSHKASNASGVPRGIDKMGILKPRIGRVRHATVTANIQRSKCVQKVEALVRSAKFEGLSMSMIFLSAMHIGLQTDYMVRNTLAEPPFAFRVFDLLFLAFFVWELVMRLLVYRYRYFTMFGWHWNVMDLILVTVQVIEELVELASNSDAGEGSGAFSSTLLRVVRILRAVRVVRILHATKFAEELRLLVTCVGHSAKSFHFAAALIFLMIYVVGVHLSQLTLMHQLDGGSKHAQQLDHWYGSVPRSLLSLFQGLTGGVDWNELVQPLMDGISPWLGVFFAFYMSFAIIAVMNVITGTFVQHAMERATHIDEVRKVHQASNVFRALDKNHTGFITFEEIQEHLESKAVMDFFKSIDLDLTEARCLFDMLDSDGTGRINFEDFLGGAMRLQGPAKAIDLVLVMRALQAAMQGRTEL